MIISLLTEASSLDIRTWNHTVFLHFFDSFIQKSIGTEDVDMHFYEFIEECIIDIDVVFGLSLKLYIESIDIFIISYDIVTLEESFNIDLSIGRAIFTTIKCTC